MDQSWSEFAAVVFLMFVTGVLCDYIGFRRAWRKSEVDRHLLESYRTRDLALTNRLNESESRRNELQAAINLISDHYSTREEYSLDKKQAPNGNTTSSNARKAMDIVDRYRK